ncbi:hypothetical protein ELI13_12720 [Rhizobium ruizarguesonis]|uniref:Uncharacterized protein n=1 Tax=Rhizobium ruizarguesonis TaxID=2081791 RepID=A0ABY1XAK7_9HYPH|nr:hypothetical protein [Rhizobium ruizarguesonis]NKJ74124.1 hypothetical protein [Rhizobium leguminosarum bv. viciae]MBC2804452.1 hypothetical protein [Rhizobium ruizarguesonis]TAU25395.1 hypothetical protein ELI48_03885 [Rhizobium ruizarguesonis]TAU68965.1 hypothetical protein ELI45_14665 [Rhizobium ruizarguesonis]TAU76891.1 hypothetical protein ELI46_12910 [Rhizobium ruizarguesonis]
MPALITRTCDVADLDSLSGWLENNHTHLNGGLRLVAGDPKGRARYHGMQFTKKSQPKTRPKT